MRFTKLYVWTIVLASLILAASACQTAQKPAALMPPGSTPALKPAPVPAPAAAAQTQQPTPAPQAEQAPQKPAEAEPTAQAQPATCS